MEDLMCRFEVGRKCRIRDRGRKIKGREAGRIGMGDILVTRAPLRSEGSQLFSTCTFMNPDFEDDTKIYKKYIAGLLEFKWLNEADSMGIREKLSAFRISRKYLTNYSWEVLETLCNHDIPRVKGSSDANPWSAQCRILYLIVKVIAALCDYTGTPPHLVAG